MKKTKQVIIKNEPDCSEVVLDCALQCAILTHVATFGFSDTILNVVEAYRTQARRYNEAADKLEQKNNK